MILDKKQIFGVSQTKSPPALIGGVARSAEGVDEINAIYLLPNDQSRCHLHFITFRFICGRGKFVCCLLNFVLMFFNKKATAGGPCGGLCCESGLNYRVMLIVAGVATAQVNVNLAERVAASYFTAFLPSCLPSTLTLAGALSRS